MNFTIRRDNGNRIIWEQSQIDYIIKQYKNGISCRQISKKFNVRPESISRLLKKQNIQVKTISEFYHQKYPRYSNYFNKIDTREKAYWLGFLYADGCITKGSLSISIQDCDKEHLEKFKQDIGAINHKITEIKKENKFGWHFSIRDSQIINDLKKLGCIERKSLILVFPSEDQVPQKYIYDFIRGYFDGDGTLSFNTRTKKPQIRFGFCGTKMFLESIKKILNLKNSLQKTGQAYTFVVSGNKIGLSFFEKIYNNPTRFLNRKYSLYQSFLELQRMACEPINIGCE